MKTKKSKPSLQKIVSDLDKKVGELQKQMERNNLYVQTMEANVIDAAIHAINTDVIAQVRPAITSALQIVRQEASQAVSGLPTTDTHSNTRRIFGIASAEDFGKK